MGSRQEGLRAVFEALRLAPATFDPAPPGFDVAFSAHFRGARAGSPRAHPLRMHGHTPGPRERALEEGVDALGDAELVAILLGTGLAGRPVALVAAALLERAGGVEALGRLGPAAIAEHPGVGLAKALRIAAALELGRRAARRAARAGAPITSSAEIAAVMGPQLAALVHEEMWIVCLDGRNRMRAARRVAQGGLHACAVGARDVLRVALLEGASAMVLVHNHPGGDPRPSAEDLVMTRRIAEASLTVGVPLIDHVIVTPSGAHASMLDLGVLEAT